MKKIFLTLLPCLALGLASCGDSSYEVHNTYFYPLQSSGIRVYADQQTDTIHLISLDSWTAQSSVSWMTVSPTSATASGTAFTDTRMTLTFEDNATGSIRYGAINVESYSTLGMPVFQYSWLNITRPAAVYYTTEDDVNRKASFPMSIAAAAADTTLIFTVYQDGATLASDADWAVPGTTTFEAGTHTVPLSVAANAADSSRTATLTLTSGTVSSQITLTQAAREDE